MVQNFHKNERPNPRTNEWWEFDKNLIDSRLCETGILDLVCETFLKRNVSAVLFLSNTELYGRNTAAAQYFLQLTNYLRIPVIAWNADNSGLEKVRVSSTSSMKAFEDQKHSDGLFHPTVKSVAEIFTAIFDDH